jgi:hypothetical protein
MGSQTSRVCFVTACKHPHKYRYEEYYYTDHEEWLKDNNPHSIENEGIDVLAEYKYQIAGARPGQISVVKPSGKRSGRLMKAMKRCATGPVKHTPKDIWRQLEYQELVRDNMRQLGMNTLQVDEVNYILEHDTHNLMKIGKPAEDIITCICLHVMARCVNNSRMSVIKRQLPAWKDRYKTLYQLIRDKLNS